MSLLPFSRNARNAADDAARLARIELDASIGIVDDSIGYLIADLENAPALNAAQFGKLQELNAKIMDLQLKASALAPQDSQTTERSDV